MVPSLRAQRVIERTREDPNRSEEHTDGGNVLLSVEVRWEVGKGRINPISLHFGAANAWKSENSRNLRNGRIFDKAIEALRLASALLCGGVSCGVTFAR